MEGADSADDGRWYDNGGAGPHHGRRAAALGRAPWIGRSLRPAGAAPGHRIIFRDLFPPDATPEPGEPQLRERSRCIWLKCSAGAVRMGNGGHAPFYLPQTAPRL